MADLPREQVVDYLSNLPVIHLADLIKTRRQVGVKAAPWPLRRRRRPPRRCCAGRGEDRIHRRARGRRCQQITSSRSSARSPVSTEGGEGISASAATHP